jgi:hypothetical protein
MPNIDLSILNQRQTPAFYASSLATRPAFGFAGRMFIDTDVPSTGIYRDTGSAWVQIADQTGSLTGYIQTQGKWETSSNQRDFLYSGKRFIVANDNPANAGIVPLNTLFINYQNDFSVGTVITGSVGINTDTPTATFDVHSAVSVIQQLNQTVATNNSLLAFQNNNAGLWRVGNFYNAGANDFGVFDVIGAIQPVTVKKTTGQVLIGTSTVGSGKLVVASSTGDNGVQIVGAAAPSLRIDNAESVPTKRAGLGISTAANNFIQGSADRDFCMFNGSTTASPILFGIYDTTNVVEAARISAGRNLLIGTTTDAGQKLQVNGTSYLIGNVGIGVSNALVPLHVETTGTATTMGSNVAATFRSQAAGRAITFQLSDNTNSNFISSLSGAIGFGTGSTEYMRLASSTGNLLIGTTTDAGQKLQVTGTASISGNTGIGTTAQVYLLDIWSTSPTLRIRNTTAPATGGDSTLLFEGINNFSGVSQSFIRSVQAGNSGITRLEFGTSGATDSTATIRMTIKNNGVINLSSIPTSAAGLVSGDIYSNLGVLTIVP